VTVPEPALQHWLSAHLGTAGPFYIEPISGGNSNETALTDRWPDGWFPATTIGEVGRAAVEALAALHRVHFEAAGLGGFGRPAGYLERQVDRWRGQNEKHRVRDLPLFDQIGDWLEANRPAEGSPAILHGDFHLEALGADVPQLLCDAAQFAAC
jgi:aminoglycoside phosphotransferase (APT) family kinase protein